MEEEPCLFERERRMVLFAGSGTSASVRRGEFMFILFLLLFSLGFADGLWLSLHQKVLEIRKCV